MKELATSSDTKGYTPAAYKADVAAGKVDLSLLAETFSFSDDVKKFAMKKQSDMLKLSKEAGNEVNIDWDDFEAKITSPGLLASVKASFEKELADAEASSNYDQMNTEYKAKLKNMFSGPDGLYALASKEEKAADAGILQGIADAELLEKQIENVSTQTIAEILEQEPELRERVEEEIKNNVWAP
jgi:hypothetical protein